MINNKVAMSSTLAVYELSFPDRPPLEDRVLDALSPEARDEYLAARAKLAPRHAIDDAGTVPARAGVRKSRSSGQAACLARASIPPAWAARSRDSAISGTTNY